MAVPSRGLMDISLDRTLEGVVSYLSIAQRTMTDWMVRPKASYFSTF